MPQIKLCIFSCLMIGVLGACSADPSFTKYQIGQTNVLVSSAGANISTLKNLDGIETSCIRLGPDATTDISNDLSLISVNGEDGEDASSNDEIEMIGRTPTNTLLRDTLFHLCTLRQSKLITQEQYIELLRYSLKQGFDLSKMEIGSTDISIRSSSAGMSDINSSEHNLRNSHGASANTTSDAAFPDTYENPSSAPDFNPPGPPPPV